MTKLRYHLTAFIVASLFYLGVAIFGHAHAQQVLPPDGQPIGLACAYNTSPTTVSNGQVVWVQCDSSGRLIISPTTSTITTLSHASTTSLGTSLVAKSSSGALAGFNCTAITGGSAGYCIGYNGSVAPSTGALTGSLVLDSCYFSGTSGCSLSRIPDGVTYSSGIVILVSSASTPFTYTTGTDTAFISADYQ